MWDEELNTTIDEVARQMTAEAHDDASAGFRRRVLARIDAAERPRAHWSAALVLSSISVVVAIAIAILAVRRPSPLESRTLAGLQGSAATGTSSLVADANPQEPAPQAAAVARRRFEPGIAGTIPEPPPPLDPLDVAPLTVDMLQPDPIPVDRLDTIAPILVTPLESIEAQRRYQ